MTTRIAHDTSFEGPEKPTNVAAQLLRNGALLAAAATLAAATANALIAWNTSPPGGRLSGGFARTPARYGDMAYFVSGAGAPLLLLHALYPGHSSAEWENNWEALAENFTVYAPDFLGWGLSDKPHHILRAADYAEQIAHFAEDVIGAGAGTPCAVIASGHASAFALMAARKAPQLFSRFVFICPTASEEYPANGPEEERGDARRHPLFQLLTLPVFGRTMLNVLTSRSRLEAGARECRFFHEERAESGFVARLHAAAHQPGSATALAAHFAGALGGPWRPAWSTLTAPSLIVWGREAQGFAGAPDWLALKPDAGLEVFDNARLLPHVECAGVFNARVERWLRA